MLNLYILDENGDPKPCKDIIEWSKTLTDKSRTVGFDEVVVDGATYDVSTVFLGIDMNALGGPPLLWETMVFAGHQPALRRRHTSAEEAKAFHAVVADPEQLRALLS